MEAGGRSSGSPWAIRQLAREDEPVALDVLCDAFQDYPVMRHVLGDRPGYQRRLRTLVGFFLRARIERAEVVLGFLRERRLEGVALVSDPAGPLSPPSLAAERERVWRLLGEEERRRYEAFGAACQPLISTEPRLHLDMLGVRRASSGMGIGRRLLEEVHRIAGRTAGVAGVSLTTEDVANLDFYASAGYVITGRAEVAPDLSTWAMFRPLPPPPGTP